MRVAGLFRLVVDFAIVLHPTDGVGRALRSADPRVVMLRSQHARFPGGWIERQNPAILEVSGARHDHGLVARFVPDRLSHLHVALWGRGSRGGGFLTVVHPLHVARYGIKQRETRPPLRVAYERAAVMSST